MVHWRATLGLLALAVVLLALLFPLPGRAPDIRIVQPARGASDPSTDVFRGMISVEGKEVPLPVGDWQLAGRAISGRDPLAVLSVALVRLNGLTVDAAVLIQTNRRDSDAAWGKAAACDRTDLFFARIRYASDHDGSCAYAAYVDAGVQRGGTDASWQAAQLAGAGKGWRFPRYWMESAYRITDPRDAVQVRYLFAAPDHADGEAAKSLASWTEASWYDVGSGFRNRLDGGEVLPDWPASANPTPMMSAQADANATGKVEHLGTKMVTYRIFGTMTDMSENYLWLGSLPSAGGLALVSAIASSALYFVHEWVWSDFEHPPERVGDLPGVGIEGPGPGA